MNKSVRKLIKQKEPIAPKARTVNRNYFGKESEHSLLERYPKSELIGWTIAGPIILRMKNAFFQVRGFVETL